MNNATENYWNISQSFTLDNLTTDNNLYIVEETCCTTEPNFSVLLGRLENDRLGLLAFLFLFSFATVFGNSLVILAVIRERYLHSEYLCVFIIHQSFIFHTSSIIRLLFNATRHNYHHCFVQQKKRTTSTNIICLSFGFILIIFQPSFSLLCLLDTIQNSVGKNLRRRFCSHSFDEILF